MKSTDIFNHIRPKLGVTESQKDALYVMIKQGAKIETIAQFVGLSSVDRIDPIAPVGYKKLSERSLKSLIGVNENLVKVVELAYQISSLDFVVTDGLRDREQMMKVWGQGRTVAQLAVFGIPALYAKPNMKKVSFLNNPFGSKHAQGKAIDMYPAPIIDLNKIKYSDQLILANAMKEAAKQLKVNILWGGDFKKAKDFPHFEID